MRFLKDSLKKQTVSNPFFLQMVYKEEQQKNKTRGRQSRNVLVENISILPF